MAVAVDTNVLVDFLGGVGPANRVARDALVMASAREGLVIAPVVYAELFAFPGRRRDELDQFLADTHIAVA